MSWLSRYYDHRARAGDPRDFLRQVGHTEKGRPITDEQFHSMLARLRAALDLRADDVLLDLCCGNGVFTRELARHVRRAVGVDFSRELISIANQHHQADNLVYHAQDVKNLCGLESGAREKFNKILMHGALQHFSAMEFGALLKMLLTRTTTDRVFLFSFVPDAEKRAVFRQTLKPSFNVRWRRLLGRDLMGKWWHRAEVSQICAALGLKTEFLEVEPTLEGARYRFDIKIW